MREKYIKSKIWSLFSFSVSNRLFEGKLQSLVSTKLLYEMENKVESEEISRH